MFIKVGQKSLGQITPGQILPGQISLRKLIGGGRRCWLFSVKLWLKSRFIFTIYLFGGKKCTYFLKKVLITKSTYLLQFCSRNPVSAYHLSSHPHSGSAWRRTFQAGLNWFLRDSTILHSLLAMALLIFWETSARVIMASSTLLFPCCTFTLVLLYC